MFDSHTFETFSSFVQCIAPELIALRVSIGRSLTKDSTRKMLSSMREYRVNSQPTSVGNFQSAFNGSETLADPLSVRSEMSSNGGGSKATSQSDLYNTVKPFNNV